MKITHFDWSLERKARRDEAGRYALSLLNREKSKLQRVWKNIKWYTRYFLSPLALVVLIAFIYGLSNNGELVVRNAEAQAIAPKNSPAIKMLQDEVLDAIKQCESVNNTASPIQYDNDSHGSLKGVDVYSLGAYRYKAGTVKGDELQRSGKHLTTDQAIALAVTEPEARELARDAIFNHTGGIFQWMCATEQHPELITKVAKIKAMMK